MKDDYIKLLGVLVTDRQTNEQTLVVVESLSENSSQGWVGGASSTLFIHPKLYLS